jgi:hypothetical protein
VDRLIRRSVGISDLRLRGQSSPGHFLQLLNRQSVRELALVLLLLLVMVLIIAVVGAADACPDSGGFGITPRMMRLIRRSRSDVIRTRDRPRTTPGPPDVARFGTGEEDLTLCGIGFFLFFSAHDEKERKRKRG